MLVKVDLDNFIFYKTVMSVSQDLHQPLTTGSGQSPAVGDKSFSRWAVGISFSPEYQILFPVPRTKPVSLNLPTVRHHFKESSQTCISMLPELTLFTTLTITHSSPAAMQSFGVHRMEKMTRQSKFLQSNTAKLH